MDQILPYVNREVTVTQLCQLTPIKALGQGLEVHVYAAQTSGVLQIPELASNIFLYGAVQFHIVTLTWVPEFPRTAS